MIKWDLDTLNLYPRRYPKSSEVQKRKGSSLKNKKLKVIICKNYNKEKHNHAYQYRYSNRKNIKNKYHQGNMDIFNSQWSNKIYFRGPDG
jgi:hypothetical protein